MHKCCETRTQKEQRIAHGYCGMGEIVPVHRARMGDE